MNVILRGTSSYFGTFLVPPITGYLDIRVAGLYVDGVTAASTPVELRLKWGSATSSYDSDSLQPTNILLVAQSLDNLPHGPFVTYQIPPGTSQAEVELRDPGTGGFIADITSVVLHLECRPKA